MGQTEIARAPSHPFVRSDRVEGTAVYDADGSRIGTINYLEIEKVSGQTLDAFLRARIFDPLGMKDTHFYLPESKADRVAVVYSAKESGGLERAPEPGGMVGQGAYLKHVDAAFDPLAPDGTDGHGA